MGPVLKRVINAGGMITGHLDAAQLPIEQRVRYIPGWSTDLGCILGVPFQGLQCSYG